MTNRHFSKQRGSAIMVTTKAMNAKKCSTVILNILRGASSFAQTHIMTKKQISFLPQKQDNSEEPTTGFYFQWCVPERPFRGPA
jgi:hypothetical protein